VISLPFSNRKFNWYSHWNYHAWRHSEFKWASLLYIFQLIMIPSFMSKYQRCYILFFQVIGIRLVCMIDVNIHHNLHYIFVLFINAWNQLIKFMVCRLKAGYFRFNGLLRTWIQPEFLVLKVVLSTSFVVVICVDIGTIMHILLHFVWKTNTIHLQVRCYNILNKIDTLN